MSGLEVRIVQLEPMRVAAAHGFGAGPELIAWEKILTFAQAKGLLGDEARFFGFNNPDPSPGSPNYGYEQWITVGDDVEGSDDIQIKTFDGGLYAVTRCEGLQHIGEVWRQLAQWREDSPYQFGSHQWLEEALTPPTIGAPIDEENIILDLYLPIAR